MTSQKETIVQTLMHEYHSMRGQVDELTKRVRLLENALEALTAHTPTTTKQRPHKHKRTAYSVAERATFTDLLHDYLRMAEGDGERRTKRELASAIGLNYTELVARLNGSAKSDLSCSDVHRIVRVLIEWGAITSREAADDLCMSIRCTPLAESELKSLEFFLQKSISLWERIRSDLKTAHPDIILKTYDQGTLEKYITDDFEPLEARLQLLRIYLNAGYTNRFFFSKLSLSINPAMRFAILRYTQTYPVRIRDDDLKRLLCDEDQRVVEHAVRAFRHLYLHSLTQLPLETLEIVKDNPYWLIRQLAIVGIIKANTNDSMALLHRFRHVPYHKSRQNIREYITQRFEQGNLVGYDYLLAEDILLYALNDPVISHPTRQRTLQVLAMIRGSSADLGKDIGP